MALKMLNKIKKNNLLIAYKILHDWLFIALVLFFGMLIGEILLPGLVSTHVGFFGVIIFVCADIMLIRALGKYLQN